MLVGAQNVALSIRMSQFHLILVISGSNLTGLLSGSLGHPGLIRLITNFKALRNNSFKYSVCWNSLMVEATRTKFPHALY